MRAIPSFTGLVLCALGLSSLAACMLPGTDDTDDNGGGPGFATARGASRDESRADTAPSGECVYGNPDEPNDTRDEPTRLELDSVVVACIGEADADFYEFSTPPGSAAGGFARFEFRDIGTGLTLDLSAAIVGSNIELGGFAARNRSAPMTGFWALAPATSYRFRLGGSGPYPYTMETFWTPIDDVHEPNQTRETASPIEVGVPVEAYMFSAPTNDDIGTGPWDDWYQVRLSVGRVHIEVRHPPETQGVKIYLYDDNFGKLGFAESRSHGADTGVDEPINTAGTYYFVVGEYFSSLTQFTGGTNARVPPNFVQPYELLVTQ